MSPQKPITESANLRGFQESAPAGAVAAVSGAIDSSVDRFDDDLSIVASDEDGSSQDSNVLRGAGNNSSKQSSAAAPVDLVRKETFGVNVLRYMILLFLLGTGILFAISSWFIVTHADDAMAELEEEQAHVCMDHLDLSHFQTAFATGLYKTLSNHLSAAFTLSVQYTSFSLTEDEITQTAVGWPQITLPYFEPLTTGVLQTTGALRFRFAPLVPAVLRNDFETFAIQEQTPECDLLQGCQVVEQIYNTGPIVQQQQQNDGNDEQLLLSPVWQIAPTMIVTNSNTNSNVSGQLLWNQFSDPIQGQALTQMIQQNGAVLSKVTLQNSTRIPRTAATTTDITTTPITTLFYPIFQDFKQVDVVGSISMEVDWTNVLKLSLPYVFDNAILLLTYSCDTDGTMEQQVVYAFTIQSDGNVRYLGPYDVDAKDLNINNNNAEQHIITIPTTFLYGEFDLKNQLESSSSSSACKITVRLYPDADAAPIDVNTDIHVHARNRAPLFTSIVIVAFVTLLCLFLVYDWLVEKRQSVVVNIATKSTAIVENLFPAQVRDRMLQNVGEKVSPPSDSQYNGDTLAPADSMAGKPTTPHPNSSAPSQVSVKQFLTSMPESGHDMSSQPIADLFPNTTVLFADIAGFTAWSSQREPPQVFTLLETLYRSFDVIAGKLKVFKVETIGDCYMAVTGLPNPDESHAIHMSRFAYQCLIGMKELIRELEAILGPGTSDLALRVGLHSGPVTAGVLRGEKSRFQLFGDTVNTASRMESTGERGRIQVSQETGDLLMAAGKSHWLKPRDEVVVAKGKGELKTYWLDPTKKRRAPKNPKDIRIQQDINLNNGDYSDKPTSPTDALFDDKYARLIDWNVDVLLHHLARVISCRSRAPSRGSLVNHSSEVALLPSAVNDVAEVVALPPFDTEASRFRRTRPDVSMLQQTRADLHEYVKRIALMYRDVPFHNFEHASHVTLCANKLLNRLINSDEYETEEELHSATFGISSDPLTHFAIVFAALIHDVDHTGLPNAQLVKDQEDIAVKFDNKSVAEQNSVHLGWEMLMDPRFERLRKCIYQTNVERKRFRQLVINSVMATDIADRQVNEERQNKWDKAFRRKLTLDDASPLQVQEDMNRKATAVIEHIIQVSDVAHTMQHWHIYRRWNERLFHEMHDAFQSERVSVDPSTNWYIGELGFFDYYLIPLAMKLKECGVFGASGYEYISYVLKNKKEWERKGRQVVQEMVLLYKDSEESDGDVSSESGEMDSDDLEYDSPGDMTDSEDESDMDSTDGISED